MVTSPLSPGAPALRTDERACRTHRHPPRRRLVLAAVGALLLSGCLDEPSPTDPSVPDPAAGPLAGAASLDQNVIRGHEAMFHEISQQVKGFGGYFYDEQGNLVAYLVDPAEEGKVREILERVVKERVPSRHERSTGSIVIRKGAYSFPELSGWRDRATHAVLDVSGVEWTDLDEARNRFAVGLSNRAARSEVEKVLSEYDVPLAAVAFETSGRAVPDITLKDYKRPIEGGYQIQRAGGGTCTLGFNAYRSGLTTFLTNSHCTSSLWKPDGVNIYQNSSSAAKLVGYEYYDPTPWKCGIFGLFRCRWSDAAVIYKLSKVSWSYGKIARTTFWGYGPGNSGSTVVNATSPSMTIIGEYSFPTGGEMFDKMGRTTGWTYGFVKKTCVDLNRPDYTGGGFGRILCTDWANYHRAGGDSGSPVFRWYGSTVRLAGIHWGGINSGGTTYGILSAMWNIEHDLGALTTN